MHQIFVDCRMGSKTEMMEAYIGCWHSRLAGEVAGRLAGGRLAGGRLAGGLEQEVGVGGRQHMC
jgi:hypothetical protein